jgi:hypothetical protein
MKGSDAVLADGFANECLPNMKQFLNYYFPLSIFISES